MTTDIEQATMRYSIQDVIKILENEPVRPDHVGQFTVVQVMNRVSIAHLSIERALKFLITRAGRPLTKEHHLGDRLRELAQHEPRSADFLNHAFQVAVQHYRLNPKADNMGHLKSLESYLDVAGSDRAFQDLRYWELHQSPDEVLLRRLYLALHIELLYAVLELLRGRPPTDTVAIRVERAVKQAMQPASELACSSGTPQEDYVRSYLAWRRGFASWCDALADAVRSKFTNGDGFANGLVVKAYRELLESSDLAVSYFAGTLDVLPRQPRDVIPPVEWIETPPQQRGFVNAPSGEPLGEIARRWDGLWDISPFLEGAVGVTAKAASQTDAQCYLAALFSRVAEITVNGEQRRHRIVTDEVTLLDWSQAQFGHADDPPTKNATQSHEVVFWDVDHGLKVDNRISLRVRREIERPLVHVLEGVVTMVEGHVIRLVGSYADEVDEPDSCERSP
ncbi:MAG: hypothetical protein OXD50_04550 [Chloroflexi bacterium]|nr:hypothetical protein [Chloroflexota bacterium]